MRIYSYVVARDYGFAPNPFYGYCTLATCKPKIRSLAKMGDWVIGTGSAKNGRKGHLVYAMTVDEVITFDQYWHDPRFAEKKPNLHGSVKQAYGDNIYHKLRNGHWQQEDSHHSLPNGSANAGNLRNDTQAPNVLISQRFAYYGGEGPEIPRNLRDFEGFDLCANRGYKSRFPSGLILRFEEWLQSLNAEGYLGAPLDWRVG